MDVSELTFQSDSAYSAPKTAESSSSAQVAFLSRHIHPRKRKIDADSTALQTRSKRLRKTYNDKYRELFNRAVNDIVSEETPKQADIPVSQIGVTTWSPEEKDLFFCSLARRGRHAIQGIATHVGSKSESEVYLYIEKLQKAATDEHLYNSHKNLPQPPDVPAAFEVSHLCCASLEVAADALSILQQQEEERLEKKKYRSFSVLTSQTAHWAERCLAAGEKGRDEILETLPASELLNLKTFLTLSKRFFMNSSIMENNWRTYTDKRRPPMITYTAFSDFHELVMSIIHRIVQSSLFFAMSRRRALDASGYSMSGRHVRRADVIAAVNVLRLEGTGKRFWAGVARKCKLRVYENVRHRQASGTRYSYNELEAILSSTPRKARGRSRAASKDGGNLSDAQEEETAGNGASAVSDDSECSEPGELPDEESDDLTDAGLCPTQTAEQGANKQELREAAHDTYAEALDQRASRAEERRLWELLGEDPAEPIRSENVELPTMLLTLRKDKENLTDWKTGVSYAEEWEVYETPVPATDFTETRRRGRTHGQATGLTDSESDIGMLADDFASNRSSSRRSSSRRIPISDESVCDESSSDFQMSGVEEGSAGVELDDDSANHALNGASRDPVDDEPEEPQRPSSTHNSSSLGDGHENTSIMVDEDPRDDRPSMPIASGREIQYSVGSGDADDVDDTDEGA